MNEMKSMGHRLKKKLLVSAVVLLVIVGVGYGYYRYKYPYGSSHNCSKSMLMYLISYADTHGGNYPSAGGAAASLALLVDDGLPVEFLAGKSVSASVTKKYYAEYGTLSDEVCGWHYVEGLKNTDSEKLAIMWSKVPLGHNGQRLKTPAYEVIFIGGSVDNIKEFEWSEFLAEQERLRAAR